MKFYKRWIGDYTRKTRTLTATEHGVYTLMLDYAYSTEEPLPLDEDDLRVLCSAYTEAERAAVPKVLAKFWRETPDGWVNDRVREELPEAKAASERQASKAKKRWSGDARNKPGLSRGSAANKPGQSRDNASHSQTPDSDSPCRENLACAVSAWNEMAERCGLARVQRITNGRRTKLAARLKDCGGIKGWQAALGKIETNPFLRGENDRQWRADFDFLLQESSFTKLMEGAYERSGRGPAGKRTQREITANGLAAFREALDS